MGFEIARRDADDAAAGGLGDQMLGLPAGARGRRFGGFEGGQECVAGERIGGGAAPAAASRAQPAWPQLQEISIVSPASLQYWLQY